MNGRRSIAPRREWDDRHFMNREPSLIDLNAHRAAPSARAPPSPQGPQLAAQLAPVPAPAEVTFWPNMAARAQEVRSLPIGTSPTAAWPDRSRGAAPRCARGPACADTDIRKSTRDHYLLNKLFVLLSKNIRAVEPAAEPTRSCTREPLPRRGETDEGRPRRRRRRLRRTRTSPAVPFHWCAAPAVRVRPWPLIITAASVEPIDRRVGTNIRPSRARTPARAGRDEDSHIDARCLANCSPTPRRRRCASFEIFSRKLTCTVAMDEAGASAVASPRGLSLH